jgi:hypothetical protein
MITRADKQRGTCIFGVKGIYDDSNLSPSMQAIQRSPRGILWYLTGGPFRHVGLDVFLRGVDDSLT